MCRWTGMTSIKGLFHNFSNTRKSKEMHTKPIICYKGALEANAENVYYDVQQIRSLGHKN